MQTISAIVYGELKVKYPKTLLLFRVDEVYQAIQKDAVIVSKVLGIHLNKQVDEAGATIEFIVFPHYALDTYLPKLITFGFKVAVCEELDTSKQSVIQATLF